MTPLGGLNFNYFLNGFGIPQNPSYESCLIEKVQYFKQSKKISIHLVGKEILDHENVHNSLNQLKTVIEEKLGFSMEVFFVYDVEYTSLEELINMNWKNILYILQKNVPSFNLIEGVINNEITDSTLKLIFNSSIITKKMRERRVDSQIENYFLKQFKISIKCNINTNVNKEFVLEDYEQQKENENLALISQIKKQNPMDNTVQNKDQSKDKIFEHKSPLSSSVLLGKNFSGEISKLIDIRTDSGRVIVEGEIFSIEIKELSGGKKLAIINITDYTNSITAKIFERKNQTVALEEMFVKGQVVRVRGDVVYDKFIRENIIMLTDAIQIEKVEKDDIYENKRVELHLHTQMSAMDGTASITDLIKKASKWGHKAIAVTDHGVVQAFPEAMDAGKKYGVKVIYGMEGYLVDDEVNLIEGEEEYSLDDEFVIFDIETTGLSSKNDEITEIGAVKIKNNMIIDSFSALINPEKSIPEKIVELTGITNDMVKDKPTIATVLPEFLEFIGNSPVVAHNADFDTGFIRDKANRYNMKFNNITIDTLKLARVLLPNLKRHRLNVIAKELNISLENHHRAVDDAKATAEMFIKFIEMMKERNIVSLKDINTHLSTKIDFKTLKTYHIVILAKNYTGLENLYKIVSESHLNYFYKRPRIPRSLLNKYREGLILGTACEAGELFQSILSNKPVEYIEKIAKRYDYLEIQPIGNNKFLIEKGLAKDNNDLRELNRRIVELGEKLNLPVVATGDVHFLDSKDSVFRKILMAGQGFSDADDQAPLYFKTTDEMIEEFSYLGKAKSEEVVIQYPNKICDEIEHMLPIPDGTFPPEIEGSEEELRRMCYEKAERIYGKNIPELVKNRLDKELNSIINNGYAVMYIIAHKLVAKSLSDGYLVGSRGSVGSSFAATMSDITEVNPLPPHYVCPKCKYSEFILDGSIGSGADLPDKDCPKCGEILIKDGHDIPFEVFLGFEGDKEPDIDLNFAGEYQSEAHKYTEELFGKGKVYRAGTIGTVADKTAYGFVRKYIDEKQLHYNMAEINRLTAGCTGIKRTSGQHPGGVMIVPAAYDIHKFCPIQYPANDSKSGVITTHFDYHSISGRLLKLDILGHDVPTIIKMLEDLTDMNAQKIPLDDKKTIGIFTSTEPLGISSEEIECEVGTLGIPEFGTKFVRQMLIDTQPKTFAELVRISGLSHGTDVWLNNAQDLVRNNIAELKDVISTRDDIMNYLILKGLPPKTSFKIMENVRKGKGLTPENEQEMKEHNVPDWYIDSCNKIKYMFPKAHAAAYVMMSFRIAYFKVNYPEAFYATYFTTKAEDFDADFIIKGEDAIRLKIKELESIGNDLTAKEKNFLTVLEVALEMYCRGIHLLPVDLYLSDADRFMIVDGKLLPPLKGLQGVGQNAAKSIVDARQEGEFISLEDLRNRTKVTKTVIEMLVSHGCIKDLPETNQLSLFSLA
ncbi:PolC-type DNA polymerase III [Alkaliphilus sp. MSJ-5]|uniref:DNA polymerase III PolC-type n=1 Tax=Alkaliphilus flagellatus TaxID=2841507 RepID=A0ABS6G5Q2_9FIRM|nr:PolC-type DNA polymerase III [Alkaliphilus flagellatus]MBU5677456.1 PolC-type DNA polymerase III [Alkaliphilus flagellatus]